MIPNDPKLKNFTEEEVVGRARGLRQCSLYSAAKPLEILAGAVLVECGKQNSYQ